MDYVCITFPKLAIESDNEIFVALLAEAGFESFEETEKKLKAYIPANVFSEEAIRRIPFIQQHKLSESIKVNRIAQQNWNAVWESNYLPVVIGNQVYIYAPFHESKPEFPFRILIKPRMSFGTAHHETTALMITLMLEEDFSEKIVLDMGSGTAVLSILASMKKASGVDAIDNDEWAYNNARENLKLNHIEKVVPFMGDATLLMETKKYDIVLANITKNILLRDMAAYVKTLKKGGVIFFSGFFKNDLNDIKTEAGKQGLRYRKHLEKNKWVATRFVKQ